MNHPVKGEVTRRDFTGPVRTRAAQGDEGTTGREFTGIAVPFLDPITVWGIREQFAPGSIEPAENVLVCYRHDEPIGRVLAYRDADAGWEVDGQLSDTTIARDAATLLRDGVINKLSIAFEPLEWTETRSEGDEDDLITYTRARVHEVSLVPFPAYDNAALSEVRHRPSQKKEPIMDPENDLPELRSAIDELTRTVGMIQQETVEKRSEPHPLAQFRSMGEYVKAVAAGDEKATRAYAGLTLGEIQPEGAPQWAGKLIDLIDAKTPTLSMFNHTKDLPSEGNFVEYGQLKTANGLKVAEQLLEGDDLVFGKLDLVADGKTAKVRTIGGWTDMSRQAIERAPLNVVDLMWRGFAIRYAENLEAIAAQLMAATYAAQVTAGATMTANLTTVNGLIDFLIDSADRYASTPYSLEAVYVAPDLFKAMAHLDASPKALQLTGAPTDKVGTLTASTPQADVGPVTFKLWTGAEAGSAMAVDRQALKVQESPGAPFRLQDENIVNLTKQFSFYGYVAAYAEMPEAIVPIVAGA